MEEFITVPNWSLYAAGHIIRGHIERHVLYFNFNYYKLLELAECFALLKPDIFSISSASPTLHHAPKTV